MCTKVYHNGPRQELMIGPGQYYQRSSLNHYYCIHVRIRFQLIVRLRTATAQHDEELLAKFFDLPDVNERIEKNVGYNKQGDAGRTRVGVRQRVVDGQCWRPRDHVIDNDQCYDPGVAETALLALIHLHTAHLLITL
jgi:hypothetical protein